ncbi:MAG: four helix bundle protein [Akkermansiaceae bacterium]|jgi:four helix bundle protein|nr:four helix bundle protein [Akkermansiaceae bacterium]MDP4721205.1 four helix bundle protein [Akkermansiaceae bacterium]MDP4778853.1 four helix bundle protein [Akkermansiaceae bacterium]MDP4897916.1 four helix bundle protein [Akkermansiaceae bacterium]
MTAERFEDLRIWQNARIQANCVYDEFGSGSVSSRDFGFRDQIQRCAVSVMNNIAEGFERKTDLDFARFLDIAKGSNGEVRSMLYLAEDRNYLRFEFALEMRNFSEDLSRAIESLAKHLRK